MSYRTSTACLLACLILLAHLGALAQTVVTTCGTDVAAGGVNLETALAASGEIIIRCAGADQTIQVTKVHALGATTSIDGENKVTLVGPGKGVMFKLAAGGQLGLRRLTVRNPPLNDTTFTGIVDAAGAVVELEDVRSYDTRIPYRAASLAARNSTFSRNGDKHYTNVGVVIANELVLQRDQFTDNLSRPFQPLAPDTKPRAQVLDSLFEKNGAPAQWIGGDIRIANSRFVENGKPEDYDAFASGHFYGGEAFTEGGPSIGGAVDLVGASGEILSSVFTGNRGRRGGGIYAYGARLTVRDSEFEDNSAIDGGAIFHSGSERFEAQWPWPDQRLNVHHSKFRRNRVERDGAAILIRGMLSGDALLFAANRADEEGGGISIIDPTLQPYPGIAHDPTRPTAIALSRSFFVDNQASAQGSAIYSGGSPVRLGNALIARNGGTAQGALEGSALELAQVTIIDSEKAGILVTATPGASVTLSNSIVVRNKGGNCTGAIAAITAKGGNLQFPGATCGAAIPSADPTLNARYAPVPWSQARGSGDPTICQTHDLVLGRDVYGDSRPAGSCTVGAVETELVKDTIGRLPFGLGHPDIWKWLWCALVILFILLVVLGFLLGLRFRKHRRQCRQKAAAPDAP